MFLSKVKLITAALSLVTATSFLLSGCGGNSADKAQESSSEKIVLRYAENQPEYYPTTLGAYKFAQLVRDKTNGRIEIDVYHSGKLGDEKSVIQQVQQGDIDFARVSLSPVAEFDQELNVLQLPYLYRDEDHMWKVLNGDIGTKLLADMESKANVIGLSWYDSGARSFYIKNHEIKSPEDLKGLNIRVQESSLMVDMIKALGANPVPMAYQQTYAALENGDIDGAENNWPSYDSSNHYQIAKYYVVDEHTRVPEIQMAAKKTWESLSVEDQKLIRECAQESAEYEKEEFEKREKMSRDKMHQNGVIITELSLEAKQEFKDAMNSLYEEYGGNAKALVKAIQETK